jgi:glycosyltransferase involved in cell wall biosynthesis
VANLHARKRLGDLVRAVARLRTEFPTLRVRLVGADGGGEGRALGALARELGIEAAVELVGRRRDVTEDLAASQIFALPSGCEGVPTAMLEAMAAARPVVLADVGHIRSVVRHGVEGFLTTPGHIDGLVTHLRALLSDPLLAQAMGARGRARAREYGTEAVALRLRGVLEGAAANRARGAAA